MTVIPFKPKIDYKKDIEWADRWEEKHKPDLGTLPMKNKMTDDIEELRLACSLYEEMIAQMGTKITDLERKLSGYNHDMGK
jgi:hypothetical protein